MKLCALVVGHKKSSPGAKNASSGLTEFAFNEKLAMEIEEAITEVYLQRIFRRTYRELPNDINQLGPDFIISLHCNAFNGQASGTEVLYYHKSPAGEEMARILQGALVDALGLRDRGIKPKTTEDRGGFLLRYTYAPCVIAEPFFIDNDKDLEVVSENKDGLVTAYANAIQSIAASV